MPGTYVEKILLFPKGKSGFQQEVFPEMGSHHLKAHGKFHAAFPDGSAGNGHGGEAGQVGGDRVDVRQIGLEVIQRGISDFGSGSGRGGAYDDIRPGKGFREISGDQGADFLSAGVVSVTVTGAEHIGAQDDAALDFRPESLFTGA